MESTDEFAQVGHLLARVWKGKTKGGVDVLVLVAGVLSANSKGGGEEFAELHNPPGPPPYRQIPPDHTMTQRN